MAKHHTRKNKHSKRNARKHTAKRHTRKQRGGSLLSSALAAVKQALLPALMYSAQKHQQKRVMHRRNKTVKRR